MIQIHNLVLIILYILFLIYLFFPNSYENFWPLFDQGGWFVKNSKKYSNKISNGILTRLDCKINLYQIIKGEAYCPLSMLNTNLEKGHPAKSIWFIKHRSGGGGSQVYPTYFKDIESKIKQNIKKDHRPIPDCHCPAYNKKSQYIIQKEIPPLLIGGKKCDSRIYYIIVIDKGILNFYLSNDAYLRVNGSNYSDNTIDKKAHTNNYSKNTILLSKSDYFTIMMPKLIDLFKNLSKKLIKLFKNYRSKYLVEFQVCGADIIYDTNINPYLLELNSGWPSYVSKTDDSDLANLKIQTKKEIAKIVYHSVNNIPLKKLKFTKL